MGSEHQINGSESLDPHVAVIPYPSQGHINPLLQFSKRLTSLGIKITFKPLSETEKSPSIGSESAFLSTLESNGKEWLTRLIEEHARTSSPVCCVVYDAFLVRGAAFFTNSGTVSSFFCMVHKGKLGLPVSVEEARKAVPEVTWEARDLPSFLMRPESYPAYLEMKLSQFQNLGFADWVFCNSFHDLESEALKGIVPEQFPAKLIGPMIPSAYIDNTIEGDTAYGASLWKPVSHQYKPWLDTKPPKSVVYVSFGSLATLSPSQTLEIASALQGHNSPFLWVVRETELEKLPRGFTESISCEKGLVVTWCDQLEVLSHPSVGAFVTHCGWNSTLEGICLGIPMVGVPQWTDQLTDAKFISDVWRVGVRASKGEDGAVGREELRACLEEVMVEGENREEMRRNVVKWKELAKKALSEGGSSAKCIEEFVKELKGED